MLKVTERGYKKKERNYFEEIEWHHIVAKQAYKAMDARDVLSTVGIDWKRSSDNLIYIKTELHRRLHTNMYYSYVNTLVVNAFNKGMSDYKKGAKKVLLNIRLDAPYIG